LGLRVNIYLGKRCHQPTYNIEGNESGTSHTVFHIIAKDMQIQHIKYNVGNPPMHEHGSKQGIHLFSIDNVIWDNSKFVKKPFQITCQIQKDLQYEHCHIDTNKRVGNYRKNASGAKVSQRKHILYTEQAI
jgi:hypothetical protein